MTYNLVAIRAVDDSYDPLYPRLSAGGKGIVTYPPSDGEQIVQIPFDALYIYEQDSGGQQKQLGSCPHASTVGPCASKHGLGALLREILTRYADYWLTRAEVECGLKLGEEHKIRLGMVRGKALQGGAELPPPGEWRNYNLPAHAPFTASAALRIGMKGPV